MPEMVVTVKARPTRQCLCDSDARLPRRSSINQNTHFIRSHGTGLGLLVSLEEAVLVLSTHSDVDSRASFFG